MSRVKNLIGKADFWRGKKSAIGVALIFLAEGAERILRASGENEWAEAAVLIRQGGEVLAGYGVAMKARRTRIIRKEIDLTLKEGLPDYLEDSKR